MLKLIRNSKGSILIFNIFLILILLTSIVGVNKINKASIGLIEKQTKQDAHAFSIISFYTYTLNEITWANKKLKTLSLISFIINKVPALNEFSFFIDAVIKGLKIYQDFLLFDLSIRSKIIDLELRYKNSISMLPNLHYLNSRRQKNTLPFEPELIEIKNTVFDTACINHKNPVSNNKVCVYSEFYKELKNIWIAPTDEKWGFKIYDLWIYLFNINNVFYGFIFTNL